jgi:RNA polymerase sigma factor (sigma-70 family)
MTEQQIVVFYQQYSPQILRYLKKYLPFDEAKEILNDVFLEAVDSLPTLQKQTNLKAWLYKIAHNKMVDFYRKKKIKSFLLSQLPYLELFAHEIHQPEFILEKKKSEIISNLR